MSDISKLPKWAQQHINDLTFRAESAEARIKQMHDEQTPTPFYTTDLGWGANKGPDFVKRYLPTKHDVTVEHEGVELRIVLPCGAQGRQGIELSWTRKGRALRDVVFQPTSFQQASLFLPEVAS